MKALQLSLGLFIGLLCCNMAFAQSNSETIKVWGNCGMCKDKIENAAKKAGATFASWSEETHQLKVSYDAANTTSDKIQKAIAKVGYDTEKFTAKDKAYNKLHSCCKYERKDAAAKCCTNENCCKDKACCKDMSCCKDGKCSHKDAAAKCCTHENCGKEKDCCKGMSCCKDAKCGN